MIDVVAIGELLIDFTCTQTGADGYPVMAAHPGGAPANFLAALAKFGAKTALLGKVGDDMFGKLLTDTLKKAGISIDGIVVDKVVFTTLAFVKLDTAGERSFSFARKPGADTCLTAQELNHALIDAAKVFHFGTLSLTDEPAKSATQQAVAYAKSKGKLITFDPNVRMPLWRSMDACREQVLWGLNQADVVKISDEEVKDLFGLNPSEGAEFLMEQFDIKLVFVTCGAKGCYYRNPVSGGFVPALKNISAIDTTGAGDIFGGSAVWQLLQIGKAPETLGQREMRQMVMFATASAGLSTMKAGGISSVPDYEDVIKAINKEQHR